MQRLEEIHNFRPVKSGGVLVLDHDKRRVVRLETNTEGRVRLELETATDIRFLAHVEGRDTLMFVAEGPCVVRAKGDGEIWWFTPEMETTAAVIEDPEIFTQVMERRSESPEMAAIRRMVREGELRREQALAHDRELLREAIERANSGAVAPAGTDLETDPKPAKAGKAGAVEPPSGGDDNGGEPDEPPAQ